MILDSTSLVNTLDNINQMLLVGEPISDNEGLEAARWISSLQGGEGSYRGMFAPTQVDFEQGIHVFTGEKLAYASARHIMGEEAAWAVLLLGRKDPEIMAAYDRAIAWMSAPEDSFQDGTFCCGRCTLAFWRHTWVGDFQDKEELMVRGLQKLNEHRIGDGKWRRFPFYYAIYTLLGIELEPAREELKYAGALMERLATTSRRGVFSQRRQMIIEKALERL
jgi:hypothetical protein